MFDKVIWGNTIQDWLISLTILVGAFFINRGIILFNRRVIRKHTKNSRNRLDDLISHSLERPLVFGIMLVAIWAALHNLALEPKVDAVIEKIYSILTVLNVTWFISQFITGLIDEYGQKNFNDRLRPLMKKGISILVWLVGLITALHNAGIEVATLLGALGVGGMAAALAAQDTIKNIFGGITIFTDKPFHIGDVIRCDEAEGTVTDIGLRSTRVKTYDNRIITVANYKLTDTSVMNISSEPHRKVVINLGLTYATTPEQMQQAMDILRALPSDIAGLEPDTTVFFSSFGDFSLNITFWCFIRKGENIQATTSEVNMAILTRFNAARLDFAFPTQTLYVEKNG